MTTDEYLTVPEVAALWRCSPDTVHRAIRRGALPAFVDGRLVRVRRADLDAYMTARTTQTGARRLRRTA